MKKTFFLIIPVLFITFIVFGAGSPAGLMIIPYEKSLLTAREKALTSGKDVLIFFASEKCADCKKIEDIIENDNQINKIVDQKFLCARINVDNFDGRATQQRYDIKNLPAIVILDANGKIKSKKENLTVNSDIRNFIITMPEYKGADEEIVRIETNADKDKSVVKSEEKYVNTNKADASSDSYYVQIGVFGSEANARSSKDNLIQQGFKNASYFSEFVNDKEIYRVAGGMHLSKSEAEQLIQKLKEAQITGLLRKH